MALNRRELVTIGGVLGGVALAGAKSEGKSPHDQPAQEPKATEARGKVALYGEGTWSYFALSKMPEGIKEFQLDSRDRDRLGRLLLLAAEKGWEVQVWYTGIGDDKNGPVYDVRVESFRGS